MRYRFTDILIATFKTTLILIFLEILSSALFPAIGLSNFKPAFNVLLVLYIAFKLETPYMAYIVMALQYFHSIFTIEGWGISTLIGVIICIIVRFLKDMLDFSTAISTIIVVQIFQVFWFIILASLLSVKLGHFDAFFNIMFRSFPESIFISLLSPIFFNFLDLIWKNRKDLGGGI